jgi:hypothetical protein
VAHSIRQDSGRRREQGDEEPGKCGDKRYHHRNVRVIVEVLADPGQDGTHDRGSDHGKPGCRYQRPTLDGRGLMHSSFVDDNVSPASLHDVADTPCCGYALLRIRRTCDANLL